MWVKRLLAVLIMVAFLLTLIMCAITFSWVAYWIVIGDNLFMIIDNLFSSICVKIGIDKVIKW